MKRTSAAIALFAMIVALGGGAARAQQVILYTFTGLPGAVDTCQWFNDNLTDRSIGALTRQTDLLYNRIALPAGEPVTIGGSAASAQGEQLVDFKLSSRTICSGADAIYGPTPAPSPSGM